MKLISLNIWGGAMHEPFMEFVKKHASDTDVFCFQEAYSSSLAEISDDTHLNIFEQLQEALPDFTGFFNPLQDNINGKRRIDSATTFGVATFVRSTYSVKDQEFVFVHGNRNSLIETDFSTLATGFHHFSITAGFAPLTIVNFYGIPFPGDKLDTPERLNQSKILKEFLDSVAGPKIVAGDFNLAIGTESVALLEGTMENMIKKYSITTTRSVMNEQKYAGQTIQHFADYTFVSPDITVASFEVPQITISDHLPMIATFTLP